MASSSSLCTLLFFLTLVVSQLLFLCGSASADPTAYDEKVELSVYYEPFSNESSRFLSQTLPVIFSFKLSDIVNLTLIPFGNAKLFDNGTLICTHGPQECLISTVEACAIHLWPEHHKYYNAIYCVHSRFLGGNIKYWKSCFLYEMGYDLTILTDCYEGKSGRKWVSENSLRTSVEKPKYFPWTVINGRHVHLDYLDYHQLVSHICRAYKGSKVPKACSSG